MATLAGSPVNDILGKPFQWGGRGPHVYDCIGVVRHLLKMMCNVDTPDPFDCVCQEKIKAFKDCFVKLPSLGMIDTGDVLYMGNLDKLSDQHVAFVESPKSIVVTNKDIGVHRTKLHLLTYYKMLDAYRPKKLC